MTLDQLYMLVKIAETGSIIAAAKALYRTQPTISVGIKKLEDELGIEIFSRKQYRLQLTPEGNSLYKKALRVLDQAESFEILAKHLNAGKEPEIRIAVEAICPFGKIIPFLKKCEEEHPYTRISISTETLEGTMERLINDEADLAICPELEHNSDLEKLPLADIRFISVVSPDFPLANAQKKLSIEGLKDYVQVIVKDSSRKGSGKNYGVLEGGRNWSVSDHHCKKEIIMSGLGWGRLQEHMIKEELQKGLLVPLKIKNYPNHMDVKMWLFRKSGTPMGPVTKELWEYFRTSFNVKNSKK